MDKDNRGEVMRLKIGSKYIHKSTGTEVEIFSLPQRTEVFFELLTGKGKGRRKEVSKESFKGEFREK